ncbi:MAG: DUF4124 domain-containing protein [Gammaproteobacteria bacterium]|nr:DUF4124 domain-containing protein [Gammaproteobacteria bacterium]MCP5199426.1 DUF4124 domain-containing protein [Gammaproteobacteria bacterium]
MRALALACLLGLPAATAHAEFYRWVDADGQARVSNVPPSWVREDGSLKPNHHPYSIPAQHSRMRERLAREGAALAAAARDDTPADSAAPAASAGD